MTEDGDVQKNVMELFSLTGKVGVVIGGARHLGYDMASALAEAGSDLAVTSRSAESAQESAHTLAAATGRKVIGLPLDATQQPEVKTCFEKIMKTFGRIDVLINNAGGTIETEKAFRFVDRLAVDFQSTLDANVKTMFFCCQEAIKIMTKQQSGSVINIASMSGIVGRERSVYPKHMRPNVQDYSLAKGGVIAFTKDLAAEVGKDGIRVNAISPGGFARPEHDPEFVKRYSAQTMLGRMGIDGFDLKGAAIYLASEASAYVTGHNLVVDGGFSTW